MLQRGDIALTKFPFVEGKGYKWRPALVITDADFHRVHGHCWMMMITSAGARRPGDLDIPLLDETGLERACMLRPSVCATIPVDMPNPIGRAPAAITRKAVAFARTQLAA